MAREEPLPGRLSAAHPLIVGAVLVALLAAGARALAPADAGPAAPQVAAPLPSYEVPCPAGSIADFPAGPDKPGPAASSAEKAAASSRARPVCIPVPLPREDAELTALPDALQRRADRPEDFALYTLPLATTEVRPGSLSKNAPSAADAIRLTGAPGSVARALELEGQSEPTRVVFAGERDGWTVVTLHRVRRERGAVSVLLVYGGLDSVGAGLAPATPEKPIAVEAGTALGQSASLLFAARQLRKDVLVSDSVPKLGPEMAIPTDPRNVLRLAKKP